MASNIKGITLQISADTSGLQKALSDTNKQISTTTKQLKEVEKGLKLDPSNTTLLAQKQELLSNAIKQTSDKLKTLKEIKEQAEKSNIDKNTKEWKDLEIQIGNTEAQLKKYQNQQDKTTDSTKEMNDSFTESSSVVEKNNESFLKAVAIIGASVTIIKEVTSAIWDCVYGSAQLADDINTLAKQYNLSSEEIQIYKKASDLVDVSLETITKSMAKLTKNMTSNSKDVQSAFKTLNVSIKDAKGNLRDSNDVFNETIQALANIQDETKQDSLALQIFGKSAADLGPLINGGAEQLKQLNEYIKENNLILSQDELDTLNALNDEVDTLKLNVDSIKEKASVMIAPLLEPVVDGIAKYLVDHQDEIYSLVQKVIDYVTSPEANELFDNISQCLLDIIDIGVEMAKWMDENGILVGWTKHLTAIWSIFRNILSTLKEIIQLFREGNQIEGFDLGWGTAGYGMKTNSQSGGFGEIGFNSGGYGNQVTINVTNNGQTITPLQVRGWVNIINEELGKQL